MSGRRAVSPAVRSGRAGILPCLLAAASAACGRAPSLSYQIALVPERTDRLAVTLEMSGIPRGPLVLKGYAPKETLRLGEAEAIGPDGARIPIHADQETIKDEGDRPLDVPRLVLPGPLPASLTVRYVVTPGSREGDSHMGFTGRCSGYLGKEFGFITGRNLFLLPQPAEEIRRIQVDFSLPPGWGAATPWPQEGGHFRPGIEGDFAAEHLISAAIGLGKFRERTFAAGGTTFRLQFQDGIPEEQERQAAQRMQAAAGYLRSLFGRDLGKEYVTVVVPRAPTGDEITGEGWGTGQGQTLAPLTGSRLRQFATHLIDAYVRTAPYRTEIRRPEEFWLVDGISGWYARRCVAKAGLETDDALTRSLAVDYLNTLNVQDLERNLERLYAAPGSHRAERRILAPFTLAFLDAELRSAGKGTDGFDPLVARLFRDRTADSLWSILPAVRPGFWDEFRARYVRGTAVIPAERFYALAPTRPAPDPPAGAVVRQVTLLYTGKTDGYLENCGCKVNQAGGVARRASEVERIRASDPSALLVDAGNAFLRPEKQRDLDFLSREEQSLYLRTLDLMRYDAAAIGANELAFGPDHFREMTRAMKTPYLAANISQAGRPLAPPFLPLRAAGLRLAVIGVFEPPVAEEADSLFEDGTAALTFADPVETLRREVPALKKQTDLVVAVGRLTPFTIRRVVAACPDLDMILSTEYDAPIRSADVGKRAAYSGDSPGFLGRTLVAYTTLTTYGLGSVKIGLDRAGRIASAKFDDLWLYNDVIDEPRVRDMLNRFYDRVGRQAAAQESVPPLFADDPGRMRGPYVGASRCAPCHEHEYLQWIGTPHATAYKTLLDRHRHFQPKCVSCHVVGYGTPTGYKLGAPEATLANVQCEVCHGPGGAHVEMPVAANIRRQVGEKVCLECHTPDHSDHFVYAERIPKVRHESAEAPHAASTEGKGGGK